MSDSTAIDDALMTTLETDTVLRALMPDGVFYDLAAVGATRFVIVSLLHELDVPVFGGRAFEDALYLVKAVALSTSRGDVRGAAARIDVLLENRLDLGIVGYTTMLVCREARVRMTEADEVDPGIRWYHRGGHYRVQAHRT